jgi:hypothetical protein
MTDCKVPPLQSFCRLKNPPSHLAGFGPLIVVGISPCERYLLLDCLNCAVPVEEVEPLSAPYATWYNGLNQWERYHREGWVRGILG